MIYAEYINNPINTMFISAIQPNLSGHTDKAQADLSPLGILYIMR